MNDNDPIEVGVLVVVTVPRRMAASVEKELATCIGFGQPRITTIYDVPAARHDGTQQDVRPCKASDQAS